MSPCAAVVATCPVHSDIPLMPLQLVKDAERRLWEIRERPPEPQPKPLPPQPSPSPPVPKEGDGALCQEVTGECMWLSPPSVSNVLYWVFMQFT